jgi:hypothetical protein
MLTGKWVVVGALDLPRIPLTFILRTAYESFRHHSCGWTRYSNGVSCNGARSEAS